jgi:hypothetical protein
MITLLSGSSALSLLQNTMLSRAAFGAAPPLSDQQDASQPSVAATLPAGYRPWNQIMTVGFTQSYQGVAEVDTIQDPVGSPSTDGAESTLQLIQQPVEIEKENLSLSSQQITQALNSGGGLESTSSNANYQYYDTVQDAIAEWKQSAQEATSNANLLQLWLQEGRPQGPMVVGSMSYSAQGIADMQQYSDDQIQTYIEESQNGAASTNAFASTIQTAFDSGEMTFTKAIDVPGLDYSETDVNVDHGGFYDTGTSKTSFNPAFLPDTPDGESWKAADESGMMGGQFQGLTLKTDANGAQHALMTFGGVEVYASWPSQEETVTEVSVTQTTVATS